MATDLLSQLAESEVPPVPERFDQEVHQRLNYTLLVLQLMDLALRGLPYAVLHFGRALAGLVVFSVMGRFHEPPRGGGSDAP